LPPQNVNLTDGTNLDLDIRLPEAHDDLRETGDGSVDGRHGRDPGGTTNWKWSELLTKQFREARRPSGQINPTQRPRRGPL
jgi:hypothetical protein